MQPLRYGTPAEVPAVAQEKEAEYKPAAATFSVAAAVVVLEKNDGDMA